MENPKLYPELYIWASEKTQIAHDVEEEVREDLTAVDGGTRYVRRKRVSVRFNKKTEVEAG